MASSSCRASCGRINPATVLREEEELLDLFHLVMIYESVEPLNSERGGTRMESDHIRISLSPHTGRQTQTKTHTSTHTKSRGPTENAFNDFFVCSVSVFFQRKVTC